MKLSFAPQSDPGRKKPRDAYTSEQTDAKIVNEEDQTKVSNAQQTESGDESDQTADNSDNRDRKVDVLTNAASVDDSSHHPETVTPELLEDERKEEAGINP